MATMESKLGSLLNCAIVVVAPPCSGAVAIAVSGTIAFGREEQLLPVCAPPERRHAVERRTGESRGCTEARAILRSAEESIRREIHVTSSTASTVPGP